MSRDQIMKALKEILANQDIIQKVRELNFDKKVQVKDEIDQLEARKDEELEHMVLRNRYLGRLIRDAEEKRIDEIKKSIREKKSELGAWLPIDNNLINWLLKLDEIEEHMKTMLMKTMLKKNKISGMKQCQNRVFKT